uniref:Uncharacterized protein n=1 Tax=Nelumbo nucifera TaxID=4432 RepID=A0A822XTU6_NELNU|nr:TPA_asm: hypothetical protein HUJ06_025263 [Nelumbo nucifera]
MFLVPPYPRCVVPHIHSRGKALYFAYLEERLEL